MTASATPRQGSSTQFDRIPLVPHPNGGAGSVQSVVVSGSLIGSHGISVSYDVHGDVAQLYLPAAARAASRCDELWRHTCFELFATPDSDAHYLEFNFSPAGDWAAYAFDAYRTGRSDVTQPQVSVALEVQSPELVRLRATANLRQLAPGDTAAMSWHLNLAAVIEARSGELSYWAVCHPRAQPDFHDRAGFGIAIGDLARGPS